MKRIVVILCFFGFLLSDAYSQQLPQYSQYLLNDFVINPAMAGRNDYSLIQSNVRYQWLGFNDAPRTFTVSVNLPYKPDKVGLGGYMYTDIAGPLIRSGASMVYAYHIELGEELRLSMGMFGGFMQYRIDGQNIVLADEDERYLFEGFETALVPDASFGVNVYTDRGFAGFSFNHLFHNRLNTKLLSSTSPSFGYLKNHLFVTAGYRFELTSDLELEPSLLLKVVNPLPAQLDISARFIYQGEVWLGLQYRFNDAFVVTAGYEYKERMQLGYSYDFTMSNIKHYSTGSHEVMLGYRFNNQRKGPTGSAPIY